MQDVVTGVPFGIEVDLRFSHLLERPMFSIGILNDAGVAFRIMQDEEQSFVGTCDWRPERLNLTIKDGLVTVQRNG